MAMSEANLVKWLLETMEPMVGDPGRERFCMNFDHEYVRLKGVYKELTGKDWGASE